MSMKNSIDTIGNQTHDLLVCSAVPHSTAQSRVSSHYTILWATRIAHSVQWLGYGHDRPRILVQFARGAGYLSLSQKSGRDLDPLSFLALSSPVKRPGREACHSPPSSAEVKKNEWRYTSAPTYTFITSTDTHFFPIHTLQCLAFVNAVMKLRFEALLWECLWNT
jgi:hypothetical protein